ncbi:MAG: DUF5674 family protein [bacterium]
MDGQPRIVTQRLAASEIETLTAEYFGDMFKLVVDAKRGLLTVGGEFHADGEKLLLHEGSSQQDVWGANYYPGRPLNDRLEYVALINIRPAAGNRGQEIQSVPVRERTRALVEQFVGPT